MGAVGAPEDSAEHLVEHGERGVGENGLHLARAHDQSCQAARRVETRDIAGNEDGDFAGDGRVPRTMNALFAIRFDAEFAHGSQSLDKGDQISLARRFRPLSQPSERRAIVIVADDDEQSFQPGDRLWRQALDKVFVSAFASNRSCGQSDLLQRHRGGKQNAPLAQMLDHGGYNDVASIRARRLLDRNMSEDTR